MEVRLPPLSPYEVKVYVILIVLMTAVVAATGRLQLRDGLTRRQMWLIAMPLIAIAAVALGLHDRIAQDCAEHIHSAWLVSEGQSPFVDFFCHHSPLLYYLVAPLMGVLPESNVVVDVARALSVGMAVVAGALIVLVSRRLWGRNLDLWAVGLVVATAAWAQMMALRPDLPAVVLALLSILVFATSSGWRRALVAGALLGAGLCFTPKLAPYLALPPLVALWQWRSAEDARPVLIDTASFLGGVFVAPALFAVWLIHQDIFAEAWDWVVAFNAEVQYTSQGTPFYLHFPLSVMALAVAAWVHLDRSGRLSTGRMEKTFLTALALAVLIGACRRNNYDNQLAVLLAAGVGAAPARWVWHYLQKRSTLVASLALALVLSQFVAPVAIDLRREEYFHARAAMQALIDVSEADVVVCNMEHHPIVTHDATPLWHHWQWTYYLDRPRVRRQLQGLTDTIIRTRPAVVFERDRGLPPLVDYLTGEGVISRIEGRNLAAFLEADYRLIELNHPVPVWLWIREDRLDRMPPGMAIPVPREATEP